MFTIPMRQLEALAAVADDKRSSSVADTEVVTLGRISWATNRIVVLWLETPQWGDKPEVQLNVHHLRAALADLRKLVKGSTRNHDVLVTVEPQYEEKGAVRIGARLVTPGVEGARGTDVVNVCGDDWDAGCALVPGSLATAAVEQVVRGISTTAHPEPFYPDDCARVTVDLAQVQRLLSALGVSARALHQKQWTLRVGRLNESSRHSDVLIAVEHGAAKPLQAFIYGVPREEGDPEPVHHGWPGA